MKPLTFLEAFRRAHVLSLTRGARFHVYGYRTVSGQWFYGLHAIRPYCRNWSSNADPAAGPAATQPQAQPARPSAAATPAREPAAQARPSALATPAAPEQRLTDSPRTYLAERFTGPTCNCIGTVHPIGEGACLLAGWED